MFLTLSCQRVVCLMWACQARLYKTFEVIEFVQLTCTPLLILLQPCLDSFPIEFQILPDCTGKCESTSIGMECRLYQNTFFKDPKSTRRRYSSSHGHAVMFTKKQ